MKPMTRLVATASGTRNWSGSVVLNNDWRAGWLASLPLVSREITTSNPTTANREFGLGDLFVEGTLVERLTERWAYGFGARLYAPTAEDSLGTGRWQIMPGAGIRYSFLEFGDNTFFVPKVRYAVGFAGDLRFAKDVYSLDPAVLRALGDTQP